MHTGLGGLYRVVLVVNRAGKAGKIVDLVQFDIERKTDGGALIAYPFMVSADRDTGSVQCASVYFRKLWLGPLLYHISHRFERVYIADRYSF